MSTSAQNNDIAYVLFQPTVSISNTHR